MGSGFFVAGRWNLMKKKKKKKKKKKMGVAEMEAERQA